MPKFDLAQLLRTMVEKNASDLHLTVGNPPMARVHGLIQPLDGCADRFTREDLHESIYAILPEEQKKRLEKDREIDFGLELEGSGRFRVNLFYTRRGEGGAFRHVPSRIKSLKELDLPEQTLRDICDRKKGLILVTGPTGSGKSTTLAAMIDYINSTRQDHLITIEDPIEFVHEHKKSIVNQREVGSNTHSFANALRGALREDPDVILVGEMRDLETISLAVTAAETGHLVMGTLHTVNAPKTVDRVIDVFPPTQQQQIRVMFAEAIAAVISQVLLKKKDGNGRLAALEIMIANPAIKNLIREGKTHQIPTIIQTSQKLGMQSMDQVLKSMAMTGKVDVKEAKMYATNVDLFDERMNRPA
ncbi:MAG TPA: type IV pilus twitching motility protein PilT [Thermodesulfobacteriota bacterium]|nr:type IV pilus twitching motility protein PilT [Thermodesulfobacteriota bacterium]